MDIAVCTLAYHTAAGTHMPHGITQCYLSPGRGDFPALTPAEAGTDQVTPEGCKAATVGFVSFVDVV